MKKTFIVFVLLILAFALTGCKKEEPLPQKGLPPLEPERLEVEQLEVEKLEIEELEVETITWG